MEGVYSVTLECLHRPHYLEKVLEPGATETTLMKHSLSEGFFKNQRENHSLVVGIDVRCVYSGLSNCWCSNQAACCSIWIYQTIAVYHNPDHVSSGANPELRTLFYKLAHLLNSCIVPVFVFDGPGRPRIKRNRFVRQGRHWLMDDLCELIDAFGFYSHQVSNDVTFSVCY